MAMYPFRQISCADPSVDALATSAMLKDWFLNDRATDDRGWEEDTSVLDWMEDKVRRLLYLLWFDKVIHTIHCLVCTNNNRL